MSDSTNQPAQLERGDPMTGMTGIRRDLLNYGFGGAIVLMFAFLLVTARSDVLTIFAGIRSDHREDRESFIKICERQAVVSERQAMALEELRHTNTRALESLQQTLHYVTSVVREVRANREEKEKEKERQSFFPLIPNPTKEKT